MKDILKPYSFKLNMILIICLAALFAGCRSVTPPPPVMQKSVLAPGDEIEIRFAYADPEVFNVTQIVRPDGMISLLLVGEVMAEGKSPSELKDELIRLYSPHIKTPQIAVIVRLFRGRRVYVGGEVMRTGFIDMPGSMTALEAIMEVGGFREETADLGNIIIVRHKQGKRHSYSFNLKKSIEGRGKQAEALNLKDRDIVLVLQKSVINVNQWIDQYIRQMLPIPMSASTFVAPQASQ
jgi:polysaccharide biosynthesis/export protein